MNEVKSPKKPLIFYYVIAIIIVILFNALLMPWFSQRQVQAVDYNEFLDMVESGQVSRAEIQQQENRILFTDQEERTVYRTAMVDDPDLVQRLDENGVSFAGEEIEQSSPLLTILLSYLLPLVIFIAIGQYFARKWTKKAGGPNSMMFGMGKSNAKVYVQIHRRHPLFRRGW